MAELFRTECRQGWLIITDDEIRTERLTRRQSMRRSAITGISQQTVLLSVRGIAAAVNLTFHGQGTEKLHADLVRTRDARAIVAILGSQ